MIVIQTETELLSRRLSAQPEGVYPRIPLHQPAQSFTSRFSFVKLDLLSPHIEVGVVTTNLDDMVAFYEGFLELEFQGEIEFPGGTQRRYTLGNGVLKLVTYRPEPPQPTAPGGGRAQ